MSVKINDREFQSTLRKYILASSREVPDICNTKSFFIARRAVIETPKADKQEIKTNLGSIKKNKDGSRTMELTPSATNGDVPLAALIVNAKRGRRGLPGLYGSAMSEAIENMLGGRMRSVAFLKSAWLPAVRLLATLVKNKSGVARSDRTAREYGQPKGSAIPAREGFRVKAIIINSASSASDKVGALHKYGGPALQRAFDYETRSMKQYIADKLAGAAKTAGIRTAH